MRLKTKADKSKNEVEGARTYQELRCCWNRSRRSQLMTGSAAAGRSRRRRRNHRKTWRVCSVLRWRIAALGVTSYGLMSDATGEGDELRDGESRTQRVDKLVLADGVVSIREKEAN